MITFDNLMLNAFLKEQKDFIIGSRINKIQQPTRRELIFTLRNSGESRQLYVNIDPKFYHVCFMSEPNIKKRFIENPKKPPMFCMLLRKYLNNSRISDVNIPQEERILELFFETYNELGDKIYLCLAIELMGKYSNVILYNTDTNLILGCAHNVGSEKSSVREVYGQIPYVYPPIRKYNSFLDERYAFLNSFKSNFIISNKLIDDYYADMIEKFKFKTLKQKYLSDISNKLYKIKKSLKETEFQISKNKNSYKYRLWGDLLMANLYNLNDYSEIANVFDYENNASIVISLDKTKTIKENANNFYKKYNKSKNALVKLSEFEQYMKEQEEYFGQLLYSINITENIYDLSDIAFELGNASSSDANSSNTGVIVIDVSAQTKIYVGKNNKQNDYIVSKLADPEDFWFHTKDCPGSHVLLKSQNVNDEIIFKCATIAKQYSSCPSSGKMRVIYTKRKYLRKPPKSNLGYVTYKNEKEILID